MCSRSYTRSDEARALHEWEVLKMKIRPPAT